MKQLIRTLSAITLLFAVMLIGFNVWHTKTQAEKSSEVNITVNRINSELSSIIENTGDEPEKIISDNSERWKEIFGKDAPEHITFVRTNEDSAPFVATGGSNTAVCSVRDSSGDLIGFAVYEGRDNNSTKYRIVFSLTILFCWLLSCLMTAYIHFRILAPFRKLSDYPAHIAKIPTAEKLPESRNKYFGKFIWGMNMLSDVLKTERRQNEKLEYQRQTLIASIAHGVKTPVTNISLYADAIETGLYSDHVDIAQKIRNNTHKIEALTAELIGTASESVNAYVPEINRFYLRELRELTLNEYAERMRISMIPFEVSCKGDPMIESDKYGLFRIISQLIENAVKYGSGEGISVSMYRDNDGTSISVRNKGPLLPESELPFVFGSFWRGSNARNTEGSGIGLFISQKIASALGGSVYVRRLPETEEMEFTIFLNV